MSYDKGMQKEKGRVIMKKHSKVLLATIVVGIAALALSLTAHAELTSSLFAVSIPSDADLNVQEFAITNPNSEDAVIVYGNAKDSASTEKTASIPAGKTVIVSLSDPGMQGCTLYVSYKLGQNEQTVYCGSTNRYWVHIKYMLDDGVTELYSDKRAISRAEGSISISAPKIYSNSYTLLGADTIGHRFNTASSPEARTVVFTYKVLEPEPYTVKVVYINKNTGSVIYSDDLYVAVNASVTVSPLGSVYDSNGKSYSLDAGQSRHTHAWGDSQRTYEYYVTQDKQAPGSAYSISVKFKDSVSGLIVASKNVTVPVGTTATYDLPPTYTTGTGKEYTLAAGQPKQIVHAANNAARTYYVMYDPSGMSSNPYDIRIVYCDAATSAPLKTIKLHVDLNKTVTHEVERTFDLSGVTYNLASGQLLNIAHHFGDVKRTYNIYFEDSAGAAAQPYDIEIQYVKNTTNEVLTSTVIKVPIWQTVVHIAPAQYAVGGNTYIMSNGQSTVVSHDFSALRRVYTVFYRLEGEAGNIVDTVNPGTTIIDDLETIIDITGNTPEELEKENIVETIPDNETPLAPGLDESEKSGGLLRALTDVSSPLFWVALSGLIILIITIIAIVIRRRE
ncbi:MAG: hypothetical protein RRY69_07065 [Oscillospiraceae bacterium]